MKRGVIWVTKAIAAGGIYAVLLWYGISIFDQPDRLDKAIIGLTGLGVTYGIAKALFSATGEIAGGIMVLAEFLNRHLLEPQKQRLLQQGREEGRMEGQAQERDSIRAKLREQGYDLDKMLPPEENGDTK